MTPAEVAAIPDPQARALEAQAWLGRADQGVLEVRAIRDTAVIELRKTLSQRAIATLLHLTPAAVAAIEKRNPS